MGPFISQSEADIRKWARFIRKWNRYYKVRQELLQIGTSYNWVIAKWGRYYKVGQLYYKVEQLLQRRPVHLLNTRANGHP